MEKQKERNKKRPHEEVVAAREKYLLAKAERDKARVERKERAQTLLKERQERKAARERLKKMSEGERAQVKHKARLEKLKEKGGKDSESSWYYNLPVYQGTVEIGKAYTVKFAGGLVRGKLEQIERVGVDSEEYVRPGAEGSTWYTICARERSRDWHYPVRREDFIAEGNWYRPE